MTTQLLQGNCLDILPTIPEKSVHCIITSPPYFGLRDYGTAKWEGGDPECDHKKGNPNWRSRDKSTISYSESQGHNLESWGDKCGKCGAIRVDSQIGLEPTPAEYVANLVQVFAECWRVLRDDGTLWLNLGDSYANNPGNGRGGERPAGGIPHRSGVDKSHIGLKPKDLIGIPWRVAFALQDFGWYLRSDIIWHKPNPMPESVTDRPTKSHEYVFLLTKSQRYYYDAEAIKEENADPTRLNYQSGARTFGINHDRNDNDLAERTKDRIFIGRNKRSVWTVPTSPYKGAHFATFPTDLIKPMVLAGCPVDGYVLDPFNGSGTTGEVAISLGRNYIGIELNPEYIKLAKKRLAQQGMKLV